MAAHVVLLFLFFCKGERSGLSAVAGVSEEEQDLRVISSKRQQVSPRPESVDNFFMSLKEFESPLQKAKDDVRTLPSEAFRRHDRKPNDFDFKNNMAEQTDILKYPESAAKSLISKHSAELTLNHEKRSNLTNGEVVINARSLVPSSEEYALQPELHLEAGVGDVLPESGRSKWVMESEGGRLEPYLPRAGPRSRRRRSWLWNQFFVIEEYRGPEPVLIGRVSCCNCLEFLQRVRPNASNVFHREREI